ncbi:hypothetical protein [Phenylobacterium sp. J367]|uniref:hypothetical protein n=1 Tax=Phenylobacterium sp. J367 TaxID=2898435 RepID=UPI002151E514|nr:hypothetical protein [Phenylobacterium sp. J367]MCR5877368.1 hypothetical protein [Phenylobacterium sp. J367]
MRTLAAKVEAEAAAERAVVERALADPEAGLPLYFWPLIDADPEWGRRMAPELRRAHAQAQASGRKDRSEPIGVALKTLERQTQAARP